MAGFKFRTVFLWVALLLACPVSSQADAFWAPVARREKNEARFKVPPVVEPHRAGVRLSFELSQPSDVEVAILDASGAVVRHWAAGLVGAHAPAPFRSHALAQRLDWDGKDDVGQSATNGPFQVRLRLGAQPRLERNLGRDGQTLGMPVLGLAVGDSGEIFVLSGDAYRGSTDVRVFNAEGVYQRSLLPYGDYVPEARLASLGRLTVDEERIPVVFHAQGPALAPLTGGMRRQTMTVSPAGYLVMMSGFGSWFDHSGPRHLLALHPEGGAPEEKSFVGPMLASPMGLAAGSGPGPRPAFDHLAMSPDGRWVYLTLTSEYSKHGVFRIDARQWSSAAAGPAGMGAAFLGQRFQAGSGPDLFNNPQGLATDAAGLIYVCDHGNDRVVVFSPDGTKAGLFDVAAPEQIVVHPRTSAIYVLTRPRVKETDPDSNAADDAGGPFAPARIVKFSPWREAGVIRLADIEGAFDLMAADPVASPTRLWTTMRSGEQGRVGRSTLVPVTDRVNTLSLGTAIPLGKGLRRPMYIAADPARNRVLVREETAAAGFKREGDHAPKRIVALDLETGEIQEVVDADEVAVGTQGEIFAFVVGPGGGLKRYHADGAPWPFANDVASPGRPASEVRPISDPRLLEPRGIRVAPNGDVVVVRATPWRHDNGILSRVDVWSPEGVLRHDALINGVGVADSGLGVDAAGHIYLGANVVSPRHTFDAEAFKGRVPAYPWLGWIGERARRPSPWAFSMVNTYRYDRGSVLKFGPDGGTFYGRSVSWLTHDERRQEAVKETVALERAPKTAQALQSGFSGHPVKVAGAGWLYYGMSPLPAADIGRFDAPGAGTSARLAADPYGRVFVPDALRFSVVVLDAAGNRLDRIGRYGNADDPEDEIRFAWPACLDVADGKLYVSDRVNQRVSVIDFDYTQEMILPLP